MNKGRFFLKDDYIVIREITEVFNGLNIESEKKFNICKLWGCFTRNFDKEANFKNCSDEKYTATNFRFIQFLSYFLTELTPNIGKEKSEMLKYLIISVSNEYKIGIPNKITFTTEEDIKSFKIMLDFIKKIKVSQEPLSIDNFFNRLF